jgi:hypothetical protein
MTNTTNHEAIINSIINALTHHGDLANDGECLDEVWGVLEQAGYGEQLRKVQAEQEAEHLAFIEANRVRGGGDDN